MAVSRTNLTDLRLVGIGIPPYSSRGLSQTLTPITQASQLERSINGKMIDFGYEPMQKYASTITGSDHRPPAFDQLWPGRVLIVDCITELCVEGGPPFGREPVDYEHVRFENGFSYYRPRLTMVVINWNMDEDEWAAGVSWTLNLEEDE